MEYEDFDELIQSLGKRQYRTRVIQSPCGEAVTDFKAPFTKLQTENFLLRLGQRQRGVRRVESPQMEAAKTFGGRLFNTAFGGQVQTCLLGSVEKAKQQGKGSPSFCLPRDVPAPRRQPDVRP